MATTPKTHPGYPAAEIVSKLRQLYHWPSAHAASLIEELQADVAEFSESENIKTCGWCGGNLFHVVINRKAVWAHEAGTSCLLLTTK